MCHTNVLGYVIHTKVAKVAVEFLKARIIWSIFFLIDKSNNKTEYVVAVVANEIVVVEVLL